MEIHSYELTEKEIADIYVALCHWSARVKQNKQMSKGAKDAEVQRIKQFASQFYISQEYDDARQKTPNARTTKTVHEPTSIRF